MKFNQIAKTFKDKGITLFTTQNFAQITGLSQSSAWAALGRYKKQGLLKSPKKGWYFFDDASPHQYLLANKVYAPSYISFETALNYYSVIPEVVYSITSATTKTTREFKINQTLFRYLKIKQPAYTGYFKKEDYLIADPEKALADYLYFVCLGKKSLNDRLDLSSISRQKLANYAQLFGNKKLNELVKDIC